MLFAAAVMAPLAGNGVQASTGAPSAQPSRGEARLIVRFKPGANSLRAKALSAHASADEAASVTQSRAQALSRRSGYQLVAGRALDERTQVVSASGQDAHALAKQLRLDSDVEWVAIDKRRQRLVLPNDPLFTQGPGGAGPASGQWYLKAPELPGSPVRKDGNIVSSINAVGAWDYTTGSAEVVVAVLDTGVRDDHPDLRDKLLAGYDMIHVPQIANDGDGRDGDASDPGDWVSQADVNSGDPFTGCTVEDSSWHGTQVAGLIGAASNNQLGMAGVAWGSRILPVRVLGKCGGYDSDIVAGMRWAAGLSVPGLPGSPHPARVLNLSLGSGDSCDPNAATNPGGASGAGTAALYRETINAVNAQGAVVVVAAGNGTGHAVGLPANCPGAIGVVALRHIGTKVGFSDIGPEITIAAPGGNCVNVGPGDACMYPMLSTTNSGITKPALSGYTDSYNIAVGTSFSAPLVAGTVALMLSRRPSLTPSEIVSVLKGTARAFPSSGAAPNPDGTPIQACRAPDGSDQLQCYCTTSTCGAGMLDAAAAVAAVAGLQARISYTPAAPQVGQTVQLNGADSQVGAGRSIKAYSWSLVNGGGIVGGFSSSTNASSATLLAPSAAGSLTVRLTVTDDLNLTASTDASITVVDVPAPPPAAPPPSVQPSSGGGGAFSPAWLLGLLAATLGLALTRQRR
jgi:serine protease